MGRDSFKGQTVMGNEENRLEVVIREDAVKVDVLTEMRGERWKRMKRRPTL